MRGSNIELILLHELHEIRRLMEEYVRTKKNSINDNQRLRPIGDLPWSISQDQFNRRIALHYPTVPPVTDYKLSLVPREGSPPPQQPNRSIYENVVNAVREVLDRRSPSQRDQPLKPSEIDPKLKHVYRRRTQIPSGSMQRIPYPAPRQQGQSISSQLIKPTFNQFQNLSIESSSSSPSTRISSNHPCQPLTNFSSFRSTTNKHRHLSYGNRQRQSNIYDTLLPGHYL
ncbi:unnamed protein product [Rotaria sordida]|uniref:Uncharacterized protein n=1 Tax=Rotaria sordida TaxID=392033 RepID=A0A815XA53_9BILA|nr:unnamed protein product [Rotaria sordida]CAF1554941.1 unnamed protein product [Rotaria sordida]